MKTNMKFFGSTKHLAAIIVCLYGSLASLQAQTEQEKFSLMSDAYNLGVNDYYGSARTMGMGNAVTAVGGDVATMAFNPAGSAVASYMQFILTPGISISLTNTSGTTAPNGQTYMSDQVWNANSRFCLPNAGFTIAFNTSSTTGLKRVSVGFLANSSNLYSDRIKGSGRTNETSYTGYLACYGEKSLTGVDSNNNLLFGNEISSLASSLGVIAPDNSGFPGGKFGLGHFLGAAELVNSDPAAYIPGMLKQSFTRTTIGYKEDYIINLGFNISDIVYLGANLGFTSISYGYTDIYNEKSEEPSLFYDNFQEFRQVYNFTCNGLGIYGKFGILVTPVAGLRLGAAFQTPTSFNLEERWKYTMTLVNGPSYNTKSNTGSTNASNWEYKLSTPMRFNIGAAYTLGEKALFSADYELVNYGRTRYGAAAEGWDGYFDNVNETISGATKSGSCLGLSHIVRAGIEWKPWSIVAIRAGYNYMGGGEYEWNAAEDKYKRLNINQHNLSIGVGYDSPRSFFCDVAFRYSFRPYRRTTVYDAYTNTNRADDNPVNEVGAPVLLSQRRMMNVVATVGWRF